MAATSPETGRGPGTLFVPRPGEKTSGLAPRFSVALCTYNGARHLEAQLASIAAQTFPPDELVVRDDGSTDATAAVVAAFARRAPFAVDFQRQPVNLGVSRNFGSALAACVGDLIALCDQDDVWLPDRLESFARSFAGHPRCLAVFSDATVVGETLQPVGPDPSLWKRVGLTPRDRRQLRNPRYGLAALAGRYLVTGAALAVRRELLDRALPIPPDLPDKVIHDNWIALVAAALGGLDSLARPTLLYRQHDGQQVGVRAIAAAPARASRLKPRAEHGALAARLAALHGMLATRLDASEAGSALAVLADKAAFLRRRAELPAQLGRRLGCVVRDIRSGCYYRYCRWSVATALRDLLP